MVVAAACKIHFPIGPVLLDSESKYHTESRRHREEKWVIIPIGETRSETSVSLCLCVRNLIQAPVMKIDGISGMVVAASACKIYLPIGPALRDSESKYHTESRRHREEKWVIIRIGEGRNRTSVSLCLCVRNLIRMAVVNINGFSGMVVAAACKVHFFILPALPDSGIEVSHRVTEAQRRGLVIIRIGEGRGRTSASLCLCVSLFYRSQS
jgi:hypothetical protein